MQTFFMMRAVVFANLIACGASTDDTFTIDDQEFSHEWKSKTPMPSKRSDMTATTVGDAIYLIGGCDSDQEWNAGAEMYLCTGLSKKVEKYSPKSDSYETLGDAPRSRYRHTATALGSKIYVLGGCGIDDSIISDIDVLDTLTGKWSTLDHPMPNATSDLSSFVHGGKIYTVGGYNRPSYVASSAMMAFDPQEAGENAWQAGASLISGRGDAAAALAGGQAFVLGGFHHDDWSYPRDDLEIFDPVNPSAGWRLRQSMSVARGDKAVAVLHDLLHAVGGETKNSEGHSVPLMDVEVYDASTDRWYPGGSIPSHRFRFVAAAHGQSLYIFGGQGALSGSHGATGSLYPVLDVVDEYKETQQNLISSAPGQGAMCMLNLLFLETFLFLALQGV